MNEELRELKKKLRATIRLKFVAPIAKEESMSVILASPELVETYFNEQANHEPLKKLATVTLHSFCDSLKVFVMFIHTFPSFSDFAGASSSLL